MSPGEHRCQKHSHAYPWSLQLQRRRVPDVGPRMLLLLLLPSRLMVVVPLVQKLLLHAAFSPIAASPVLLLPMSQ